MLFAVLALITAVAPQSQDYDAGFAINEWFVSRSADKASCSIVSESNRSSLAIGLKKNGSLSILMNNGEWKPEHRKHYDGTLTMSDTDTPLDAVGIIKANAKPSIVTAIAPEVANDFKTATDLLVAVPALNIRDRYTITDGAKIWAALEACNAAA